MDFADEIAALSRRILEQKDTVETEEATKNAFIMPFLNALGYNVFDPRVVVPEFTADVGVKKGEKVDYAIRIDGKVVILVECKSCKSTLSNDHMSQLFRYFSVTEARFAILTNGIIYWLFTDIDQQNKMDAKPFFEFDMLNYRPSQVEELKKFSISNFDVNAILATASDLKYNSLLMREISKEIDEPSPELTKMLIGRVYDGKITANVMTQFSPLVVTAMKDSIRETINQRLSSAIDDTAKPATSAEPVKIDIPQQCPDSEANDTLTDDETEGYQIVRAIVREAVKIDRIKPRKAKRYLAILLDDSNQKPICRLYINGDGYYIGIFDEEKVEVKHNIESLDDIFAYSSNLKATAIRYDQMKAKKEKEPAI